MSETKKETALRTLSKSLRKRFQGKTVNISWIELDAFMMKAQTREMENILNAYNDGYNDCKAGTNRGRIRIKLMGFLILSSGRIIAAPCDTPASKETDLMPHLQHQPFPHSIQVECDARIHESRQ